jgi:acyl-ACP thioesterase
MTVDEATLPPTPPDATFMRSVVRPHELDPMDHVNNGVYLDHFEDAVGGITGGPEALARLPRRIQLEYLVPAGPGDELRPPSGAPGSTSCTGCDRALVWSCSGDG